MHWEEIPENQDAVRRLRKPEKYKLILIGQGPSPKEGLPGSAIVGYRNSHGDFIAPGGNLGNFLYWCDCLPKGLDPPVWAKFAKN